MNLLIDTHLLVWAGYKSGKLSKSAKDLMNDADNQLFFSAISIWEVAIKAALGHEDFDVDPAIFRRQLADNGYKEMAFLGSHALMVSSLPPLHRDPFDRALIAQARAEGMILLTADKRVAEYSTGIQLV